MTTDLALDIPTPEHITSLVETFEQDHQELRDRFESDYDLAMSGATVIDPIVPQDGTPNFEKFVSNGPAAFLDKMVSWVSGAALKLQMEYGQDTRVEREALDDAERFFYGCFQANDERLELRTELPLQDQLAWYACARGWLTGRCVMVTDPLTGEVNADITPWDPLHTSWATGSRGLLWICHRSRRTLGQVVEEFGGDAAQWQAGTVGPGSGGEPELDVYDFWSDQFNAVVIGKEYALPPTPHAGALLRVPRVPGYVVPVGSRPMIIRGKTSGSATLRSAVADYGESVFRSNRNLYDKLNFAMSVRLTLAALARSRAYTLTSQDGSKTLKSNPYAAGAGTPLAEGDKLELLPLLESGRDNEEVVQFLMGEIQRGSIPFPAYGELGLAISGYAIKLLLQGIDSPLAPILKAMNSAYRQMCALLKDQYLTRAFGSMELSGLDRNRKWFRATVTPDRLQGIGIPKVALEARIPQDDLGKMQLVQMAREGNPPYLPDQYLRDTISGLPDTDLVQDQLDMQEAQRLLPTARLLNLMRASERRGDHLQAALYQGELIKMGILLPTAQPLGGGSDGTNGAKPGGLPPAAQPTARTSESGQGFAPPAQAGANVPPGTPRPGAQGNPA